MPACTSVKLAGRLRETAFMKYANGFRRMCYGCVADGASVKLVGMRFATRRILFRVDTSRGRHDGRMVRGRTPDAG
jgi:hypothetical protein